MLDEQIRTTILKLREAGQGIRAIARLLALSRGAVRAVLAQGQAQLPPSVRAEKAHPYHDAIVELYVRCQGNLVRVHEELVAQGATLSYPALTAYCRRHHLGAPPPPPAGQYDFAPGDEMQHDTSPHPSSIGGKERRVQIAGLALAYSRLAFIQLYPRFTRFECKLFLDAALDYIGGAARSCMIDNTSVIVLRGSGAHMTVVPEMAAFAEARGFVFHAHAPGDANRSAVVEGLFHYVQRNFLPGRRFRDFDHANAEARAWCDRINAAHSRKLRGSRRERFALEKAHLVRLPAWRPEVYRLHHRIVDLSGYVQIDGVRYSVPAAAIGRRLEVRESAHALLMFDGPRQVATHRRTPEVRTRVTLPEHTYPRKARAEPSLHDERWLRAELPELHAYIGEIRRRAPRGQSVARLRQLRQMVREYPRAALLEALQSAAHYGLYDLERLERMVLARVQGPFFPYLESDRELERFDLDAARSDSAGGVLRDDEDSST